MDRSTYFFAKAEQCRRLAATITARDDPAIATFLALAAEFETKACEITRETDAIAAHHLMPGAKH
jgi:hypothetical protein